jgi:hypothetical protein
MTLRHALAACLWPCLPLCSAAQTSPVGSASRSDSIDLLHTTLHLDLTNTGTGIISGQADITFVPLVDLASLPLDLLLPADSVMLNGAPLVFEQANEVLHITLNDTYGPGDTLTVSTFYHGNPPTDPSGFGGFYTLSNYQYDLGVAFDAVPHSYGRAWFPCFDNFVERCSFDFLVRTNGGKTVLANGALVDVTEPGDGSTISHWHMAETIPAYLASVAAGQYALIHDAFPSVAGDTLPVILAALPGDTAQMHASFANLKPAFDAFEQWFGPYRWNRVGYVLTSAGAMEHATNICYPDFAADGTLANEELIAHELSHHWFGNLITCATPQEMYINEGFADFCAMLFTEYLHGEEEYLHDIRQNHHDVTATTHIRDGGWHALNAVPDSITYGSHSYAKGANVARTLRGVLGDSLFRSGFHTVFNQHAFSAMGSAELRDALSAATGTDLTDFFNDWIFQPGGAAFMVDSFTSAPAGSSFEVSVHLRQKTRGGANLFQNVPVTVSCIGPGGETAHTIVALSGASQTAVVSSPFQPVVVRLNDDDRLALATTVDDRDIGSYASIGLPWADMTITSSIQNSPFHLRVEEFWVPADQQAGFTVSPDRWWRVEGTVPPGENIGYRFYADGRNGLLTAFDQGLMQDADGTAFSEDSLVMLYRPDAGSPWVLAQGTLNNLGSHNDHYARIDVADPAPGDYALAWRSGTVGLPDRSPQRHGWRWFPDPAHDRFTVVAPADAAPSARMAVLQDLHGRTLAAAGFHGGQAHLDVSSLPAQVALLAVRTAKGETVGLGRMHIIH